MQPKPPSASESVLTRWMGIQDANTAGNVHGGTIMKMVDEVAGVAAVRHCGTRVVTAALDRMTFTQPVYVGQLVTVKAAVNAAWRTSMEVGVRVESENVRTGEVTHTSTAYVTMVALSEEGEPTRSPGSRRRRRTRDAVSARLSYGATTGSASATRSRADGTS